MLVSEESSISGEPLIGQFDIVYRTLVKLGFDIEDISSSFEATLSTSIEKHLDWVNHLDMQVL